MILWESRYKVNAFRVHLQREVSINPFGPQRDRGGKKK